MNTGENQQAIRKIIDISRFISVGLLLLHFYNVGYTLFVSIGFSNFATDWILAKISQTGLFIPFHRAKFLSILFLMIAVLGSDGKKEKEFTFHQAFSNLCCGGFLFLGSGIIWIGHWNLLYNLSLYIILCTAGYLWIVRGFSLIKRILVKKLRNNDIFNRLNQTFPQQEQLIQNEYSVNLRAKYRLKDRVRNSWININNPFRGILVLGNPGSGKSYFVIRHIISQHIKKGFSMFVYDFKYDDLTKIAYHHWKNQPSNPSNPTAFYRINFDDLNRTHRCNPLDPLAMTDISDAAESARTILLGLNREWIRRQGDFFVESAINLLTAVIWYLRCYGNGAYCTLPHVIELMQQDYERLFTLLRTEKEIEVLINPFVNAYLHNVMEQLEGQVASAKIALARLSSPQIYFVLSGNDFTLDINNPNAPKIVCMGNNPQKIHIYGAVLSLYVNRLIKQVNKKGMQKSSLIFDEFPTLYINNIDSLIATARSNLVSTCLGIQDISQLRKDYGRDQAEVVMNIVGNIISGQVSGETSKQLSERFGKIMQERESISINTQGTTISQSHHLDLAIPSSTVASLSSGEFVGIMADDPTQPIALKTFHAHLINDHKALKKEEQEFGEIPIIQLIEDGRIQTNFLNIKNQIKEMTEQELIRIASSPLLKHLLIKRNKA